MPPIELREAAAEDIPTIVAITHAAFAEYIGQLDPPSGVHAETLETVRTKLASGHSVLALLGERVVGSVFYSCEAEYVYLGRLAVLPEYRGQGIGNQLIAYVEQRAAELGVSRVRLGVRVALPQLRARYERLGYRVYEERSHAGYSMPTYVMMEKDVTRQADKQASRQGD